jgi:uncharacterized protein YdeI (YjbR/CyaY-like superfamily)
MGERIPEVDAYIAKQRPFAVPILEHLREVVHATCPGVTEVMKWGMPHFEYKGPFAGMAAFKAHATFGFWKESLLRRGGRPLGRSREAAMGSFGRMASLRDLPPKRELVALLRRAMKLNEDGVRRPGRAARALAAIRPPADFTAALRRNRRALAVWEVLAPGHRREYLEWITGARREETRARRLATAIEWLAEGKRRNWRYEKR